MSARERSWPVPVAPRPTRSSGSCSSCHDSAAGTQVFSQGIGGAIFGTGVLTADPAKGAGRVINLAVAEWTLRRPARRRPALPTGSLQAGALS